MSGAIRNDLGDAGSLDDRCQIDLVQNRIDVGTLQQGININLVQEVVQLDSVEKSIDVNPGQQGVDVDVIEDLTARAVGGFTGCSAGVSRALNVTLPSSGSFTVRVNSCANATGTYELNASTK